MYEGVQQGPQKLTAAGARSLRVSLSAGTRADSPTPMMPIRACSSGWPGPRGRLRFVGERTAGAARINPAHPLVSGGRSTGPPRKQLAC
jgi:hypothetical protein